MEEKDVGINKRTHLSSGDRFPRIFREVTRVLKRIKAERKDAKTILYSTKFKGQNFKRVYGLTFNILKNKKAIDKIIEEIDLLRKEPYISLEHAEVMVHEIAIMKKPLPGQCKTILAMQKYENDILRLFTKHQELVNHDSPFVPRYARINTLATNVPKVIDWFKKHGYYQIYVDKDLSFADFTDVVKGLMPGEFVQDFHFPSVLVFRPDENLSQITLYSKGHIFLQDKASYIPVHVLDLPLDSKVLDCCAAPGMKTVHLADVLQNSGNIIALDRDIERFTILKRTLEHGSVTNCTAFCLDFTKVDPNQEPYSSVEYILLDPSCSGSGMTDRLSIDPNDEFSKCPERLQKLSGFQIVLLKHALKFPKVKKIVYSTCSIYEDENEFVISEALKYHKETFQVCNILPEWNVRGSEAYEFGLSCIRSYADKNLTKGFFVALIERIGDQSTLGVEETTVKQIKLHKNSKIVGTLQESDKFALTKKVKKDVENGGQEFKTDENSLRENVEYHDVMTSTTDRLKFVSEESNVTGQHKEKKKKSKKRSHDMSEEKNVSNSQKDEMPLNENVKDQNKILSMADMQTPILEESNIFVEHKKKKKKKSKKHLHDIAEEKDIQNIKKDETSLSENIEDRDSMLGTIDKLRYVSEESNTTLKCKEKKKKSKKCSHDMTEENDVKNSKNDEISLSENIEGHLDSIFGTTDTPSSVLEETDILLDYKTKKKKKSKKHVCDTEEEKLTQNTTENSLLNLNTNIVENAYCVSEENIEVTHKKKKHKHSRNKT